MVGATTTILQQHHMSLITSVLRAAVPFWSQSHALDSLKQVPSFRLYAFKTLLNMTRLGTPKCKNMASRCFLLSSTNKQIVFLVIWPGTVKQGHTCAGKVNLIQLLICPVPYMSITREGALLISILHVLAMSFRDALPNQVSLTKVLLNNVLHSLHPLHPLHSWEPHVAPLRVSPAHI